MTQLRLPDDHRLRRLGRAGLVVGVAGIAVLAVGGFFDPAQLMRSYLVGFVFWIGVPLGGLAVLLLHGLTGGAWGVPIRRPLESAALTLPLMALLFLPVALGAGQLYEWAHPEAVARDPILQHKALYLNWPFFCVRAVVYFASWILVARAVAHWSLVQDAGEDARADRRLHLLSRGGLVLLGLTMTFASFDWMMSIEPHWYSTVYGILFMGSCTLSAFAFAIPVVASLRDRPPVARLAGPEVFHDLGNLLLAFTMLWGYFQLSQFLIIWAGNLPEEVPWYLVRTRGGWRVVTVLLVFVHLALPFALLLSRNVKRRPAALAAVALWLVGGRLLDVFWLLRPPFAPPGAGFHLLDVAALLGVGGLFLAAFVYRLGGRPLLPLRDSSLPVAEGEA
ncbi:MAG TPA: hypothetical protein VNO26_08135 [Candidatus Limnocylindria bacterium]|nr:hypothetical protein [Candidatus Limnocylindria bacterium]